MIVGSVNAEREAVIPLTLCGNSEQRVQVHAVVDSGFNGYLTLAPASIREFGFPFHGFGTATLGDGHDVPMRKFVGSAVWFGLDRRIIVLEADGSPVVAMAMLKGCRLTVDVVEGGDVTVTPIPPRPAPGS